jgi:hypothetical protein
MQYVESRNQVLDHDHKTGVVRDVICRNCNGIEGKIRNLCVRAGKHIPDAEFLKNILKYWERHIKSPRSVLYAPPKRRK